MDAAGYITPEEVRLALRKLHSDDVETNPEKALRRFSLHTKTWPPGARSRLCMEAMSGCSARQAY